VGVGAGEPPEPRDEDPPRKPHDNLLGLRNRIIVGVVFAALYIATFGPRSGWIPAILSGLLGGVVFFLLLKEVDERRRRKGR
jgi:hypothetical protein